MHTRRLLLTAVAVALLVVAPASGATGLQPLLRPDEGADRTTASDPADRAPGVAPPPAAVRGSPDVALRGRWTWPLSPRPALLRRFVAPSSAWGAGHRGIDLSAAAGQPVVSVAGGRVGHVGVIAGKPTVSVLHADGVRSTYEPVTATVRTGDAVAAGDPIGRVAATGSHCPSTCVHLGAIRGEDYLDPLLLLGFWRVRLLPLDGAPARWP